MFCNPRNVDWEAKALTGDPTLASGVVLPMRACRQCGTAAPAGARFCGGCGTPLPLACPACAAPILAEHRFCVDCGTPVGPTAGPMGEPAPGGGPGGVQGWAVRGSPTERRLMTVMFCDLVGSSRLAASLDPEDFAALLVAYRTRCFAAAARHGGYVSRYVGDGILACFGYPRAVGRDAQAAVSCALELVREVPALAATTPLPEGQQIALRIGIETGLVLAGHLHPHGTLTLDELVGTAPNTAARLQHLAPPNGVVIGDGTGELVAADFLLEELPPERLAGIEAAPPRAFRVTGPVVQDGHPLRARRRRAPLFGRDAELDLLTARWDQASAGRGQTVLLSGEPGVGKSRLVQELADRVAEQPHGLIVLACTPQTAGTPLHPALAALRLALDRPGSGGLAGIAAAAGLPADSTALAEALGVGQGVASDLLPATRRRILMEALQAWLVAQSADRPLLIVAEDLHWSDPSLLELLRGVADILHDRPAMLLGTYRSDFVLPWPDRPATLRLALSPLRRPDAKRLLAALLADAPPGTQEAILTRAEGVPLFLEEFALAAKTPDVPPSLKQLFTARLDGLGEAKALAQCAAILGREVEHDILAGLSGLPGPLLEERLAQLDAADMLVLSDAGTSGGTYAFRHAVLQEAARDSLPLRERRPLHARAAALLAERRPWLLETRPESIAIHHAEAGAFAAAAPLFAAAARRTLAAGALEEAEGHLRRGLDVAAALPKGAAARASLDLQVLLGLVLGDRHGAASDVVGTTYETALRMAETLGDDDLLLPPLRGLTSFYQVRGPLSRAGQLGERLVAAAERSGDPCMLVDAWRRRGWNLCCAGRLAPAEIDLTRALECFNPLRAKDHIDVAGHDPRLLALANLCWLDRLRHGAAAAARRAEAATAAARAADHPLSACYALIFAAAALQTAGRWDDARAIAEQGMAMAEAKGFAYWVTLGRVVLGYDLVARRGAPRAGRDLIAEGLAGYRGIDGELLRPFILARLAAGEAALGRPDLAEAAMDEAIDVTRKLKALGFMPELLLQRVKVLAGHISAAERETLLARAEELATTMGAGGTRLAIAEERNAGGGGFSPALPV